MICEDRQAQERLHSEVGANLYFAEQQAITEAGDDEYTPAAAAQPEEDIFSFVYSHFFGVDLAVSLQNTLVERGKLNQLQLSSRQATE